jgi:cyclopropane-fatty-acyl-phospholipid synthase
MKTSIIPLINQDMVGENDFIIDRMARRIIHAQLRKLQHGEIVVREGHDEFYFGRVSERIPFRIHIEVKHASFWSDVAFGGTAGSGEAYIKGSWQCSDLVGLVRLFLANRDVIDSMDKGLMHLKRPMKNMIHWLSRNTRRGSRRNISAHYDLGNDFFRLFLDPTMMYSSAYYETEETPLEQAAVAKLDHICAKLKLTPDHHVLEIGTGWGGFAIHAATHCGCKVTTTTISREQYELTCQRVNEACLQDKITVLFSDYRDLEGQFDKLVSIEMIEAIGHQYMNAYFNKCSTLLKPDGEMLIQAITIADYLYSSALKDVDFIKKFIFPGGFLPSIAAMTKSVASVSDMKVFHLEDIGPHYARTLFDWRRRFFSKLKEVRELGYSDYFIRMWEFYLCYCEAGFRERDVGTVQMLLAKPQSRL